MSTTAVVVGGTGGIGAAAAEQLVGAGVDRLLLVYRSDEGAAARAVARLADAGATATAVRADVTTEAGLEGLAAAVDADLGGTVDVVVYSAAYRTLSNALDLAPAEWEAAMAAGVTGFVRTLQVVGPRLAEGGRVVAVSGLSGIRAYSTSHLGMGVAKAALHHAVRYLALELAPRGVTVNAVAFGSVLTDGVADDLGPEAYAEFVEAAAGRNQFGRVPRPEEVVGVFGFLASPASQWMTGQVLVVDGGETL